jgi:hypothetical protein
MDGQRRREPGGTFPRPSVDLISGGITAGSLFSRKLACAITGSPRRPFVAAASAIPPSRALFRDGSPVDLARRPNHVADPRQAIGVFDALTLRCSLGSLVMSPNSRFNALVRFVYTQNPFYLISACLILYGLRAAFGAGLCRPSNPFPLVGSLCVHTLLMALTAVLAIRLGKVWDDARSILLILLLQFFALSVGFDELCNTDPYLAIGLLAFGFVFSLVVSESVIRGIGVYFPAVYRLPFYAIIGLMFAYPVYVSNGLFTVHPDVIRDRIAAFPMIAGCLLLSLLPAVRRGSRAIEKNGTPWRWPWYPWSVFAVLAVGICARFFALGLSFNPEPGMESAMGLYHLVPLLLAGSLLVVEIGIVENRPRVGYGVLLAVPLLLGLATPVVTDNYAYGQALDVLSHSAGSPIWLTLVSLAAFYSWALWRGLRYAEIGLTLSLLACVCVERRALEWTGIEPAHAWPLLLLAGVQLTSFPRRWNSRRCVSLLGCLIGVVAIEVINERLPVELLPTPIPLTILAIVATAYFFDDTFAAALRVLSLGLMWTTALCLYPMVQLFGTGPALPVVFVGLVSAAGLLYWHKRREVTWLLAASANALSASSIGWQSLYVLAERQLGTQGAALLAAGSGLLLIAVTITAQKGGLWRYVRMTLEPHLRSRS